MASKSISFGFRTAASHGQTLLPHTRSIATATRQITRARTTGNTPLLQPSQRWTPATHPPSIRSLARRAYSTPSTTSSPAPNTPKQPSYELTFTCVPCGSRSAHTISKQGYHHGSILITCPSCRNRHIISDHLQIFGPDKITVEELVKKRGQLVKRGTLGEDGDIEFWEDGSTTVRNERQGEGEGQDPKAPVRKERGEAQEDDGEIAGASFGKT